MANHTPGPWTYHYNDDDLTHCGYVVGPHPHHGRPVVVVASANPDPQLEANARLIAAAPALLEACQAALEYIGGDGWDLTIGQHRDNPLPAQLRAAIAAAGENIT